MTTNTWFREMGLDISDRFWSRFHEQIDGCVVWTKAINKDGYGHCWDIKLKKVRRTHVMAWEKIYGPVPDDKELDHTCKNRSCARHLEVVTHKRNMERGSTAMRSHCKNGHEFTVENTYVWKPGNWTARMCRKCRANRQKKYDKNKKR